MFRLSRVASLAALSPVTFSTGHLFVQLSACFLQRFYEVYFFHFLFP